MCSFIFRLAGKDFRDSTDFLKYKNRDDFKDYKWSLENWTATAKYYRYSHMDKKRENKKHPFPQCLKDVTKPDGKTIENECYECRIDYIIGPLARPIDGKEDVEVNDGDTKTHQLCIKSNNMREKFQFLRKILFCEIPVKKDGLLNKAQFCT